MLEFISLSDVVYGLGFFRVCERRVCCQVVYFDRNNFGFLLLLFSFWSNYFFSLP